MVRLGEIFTIASGGTPDKKKSSYYMGGTIPWVKTGDLKGQYVAEGVECITEEGLNNSSAKLFPPNTVLLAMYGATIGACSILHYEASTNQACAAFLPNEKVLPTYLYYFLLSKKDQFVSDGVGGAQPNISGGYLKNVQFDLIPLEQQKAIAARMDKVAELIALRKEQLAKLDQLVKSRFIELFGDPFDNKKWDTQKLRNISVSISDGSNVDKAYYQEKGDVLFLRIQNVWFNEFRLDDSVYISEDINNEYLDTSLHHGDLLITKIGRYYTKDSSLGRVSVYLGEDDKANYSNNIMRVRLTDEVCSEFVNVLMNLDDYNRYIREVSVGGTDKRALSKAIIGDLPIIMPPKELQIEYLEFVKQIDKSKLAIQQSLDKLELLKKSLMQEYFG